MNLFFKKIDFKEERGFSILEVLIAAGILGVVSLGVMQFAQNSGSLARKINQETEIFKILDTIRSVLDNEQVCDSTLKGKSPHGDGDDIRSINFTNSLKKADSIKVGEIYGTGGSKFKISKMKIKNYSKGRADFEVTIEPNKSLQLVRRIPIFVNLVSDSGNASIKDCMSDRDTFLSGACQTLDGDFSDLKRCRSVILTKDDNEENALEATGNLILEKNTENGQNHTGDLTVEELISSKFQLTKGDLTITNSGSEPEDTTPKLIIGDTGKLTSFYTKENNVFNLDISPTGENFFKLEFDGSKYLEFLSTGFNNLNWKTSFKRIKLENFNKMDFYDYNLSRTDEDAEEGYVTTRQWVHNYLNSLFDPNIDSPVDRLVEGALSDIASDGLTKETIAKVFARKICSTYFNDTFAWDDEKGCYPIPTCDQSEEHFLFSSENTSGVVGFNCKKFPEMVCSKEVSFKAWQNWWDGDTKHYMAYRAAPLYKENGTWKICTEVQFVHDGSAIPAIKGDAGELGSDTGEDPSDLFTNCSYSGNPCSISVTGSETPVELQAKQDNYKDCLLESQNYCSLQASCQGSIETAMNAGSGFIHPCLSTSTNVCKEGSNVCVECNEDDDCKVGSKTVCDLNSSSANFNKCREPIRKKKTCGACGSLVCDLYSGNCVNKVNSNWSNVTTVASNSDYSRDYGKEKAIFICGDAGMRAVTKSEIESNWEKACGKIDLHGMWAVAPEGKLTKRPNKAGQAGWVQYKNKNEYCKIETHDSVAGKAFCVR